MRILISVLLVLFMGVLVVSATSFAQVDDNLSDDSVTGDIADTEADASDDETDEDSATDCEHGKDEDGGCKCAADEAKNEDGECEPTGCQADDVLVDNRGYTGTTQTEREEQSDTIRDTQGTSCACHFWVFTNSQRKSQFWPEYCPDEDGAGESEEAPIEDDGLGGSDLAPQTSPPPKPKPALTEEDDGLGGSDLAPTDSPRPKPRPTDDWSGSVTEEPYPDGAAPTAVWSGDQLTPEQAALAKALDEREAAFTTLLEARRADRVHPTSKNFNVMRQAERDYADKNKALVDIASNLDLGTLPTDLYYKLSERDQESIMEARLENKTFAEGVNIMNDFNESLAMRRRIGEVGGLFIQPPDGPGYWDGIGVGLDRGSVSLGYEVLKDLPLGTEVAGIHTHPFGDGTSPPSFFNSGKGGDVVTAHNITNEYGREGAVVIDSYVWTENGIWRYEPDQSSTYVDTIIEMTRNSKTTREAALARWPDRSEDINTYFSIEERIKEAMASSWDWSEARKIQDEHYEVAGTDMRFMSFDTMRNAMDNVTDTEFFNRVAQYFEGLISR